MGEEVGVGGCADGGFGSGSRGDLRGRDRGLCFDGWFRRWGV